MNINRPKSHPDTSFEQSIEGTAEQRALYTRDFLQRNGLSLKDFIEELKKERWGISILPENDKSLALGVAQLQKILGFRQIDASNGCDGKLGPYTWKIFQSHLTKLNAQKERVGLNSEIKTALPGEPGESTNINQSNRANTNIETNIEKTTMAETIVVGDSLSAGMKATKSIDGAKECFKGAMQTGWMLKNFRERFFARDSAGKYTLKPEYQNGAVKKVMVLGGINDITSLKSVNQIKNNLSEIYKLARSAGLTIIACTYPDWDAEKGVEIFRRDFIRHGWGNYPLSPDELQKRTQELNQWILSQNNPSGGFVAVDLHREMTDRKKYPRADFIHPAGRGSKAMANYIKKQGGITDQA